MISVEALPAEHGDCLWVEWDDGPRRRRMLIDGGPGGTKELSPALAARFDRQPPHEREFELVVCSHIDDDHIAGLLPLVTAPPEGFGAGDIWFNGLRHTGPEDTLGARNANHLVDRLESAGLPWNKKFGGCAVVVPDDGRLPRVSLPGLCLTLLSPTPATLLRLRTAWRDPRADQPPSDGPDVLGAYEDAGTGTGSGTGDDVTPQHLMRLAADRPYRADRNAANGSSIAFCAEHPDGSRVLFGADAHAEVLVASLRRLWHGDGYPVALCKVPHHGSAHNVSPRLVGALDCGHWLFSTNGGRGHAARRRAGRSTHPDLAAVGRILLSRPPGPRPTLWFNHRSPSTERYGGPALRVAGVRTEYPDEGDHGIAVLVRGTEVTRGTLPRT